MTKYNILINTVMKIKKLTEAVHLIPYKVYASRGEYVVDGKSVMGLMSLNLEKPIMLRVEGEVDPVVDQRIKLFEVKHAKNSN